MGREKLGALIRSLDYSKVKGDPEPASEKLTDLEYQCRNDLTFDELKDGFKAFEEKVCIKEFPEYLTYAYWLADANLLVLTRLLSTFAEKHEEKTKPCSQILFHTLLALVEAGPNSSHLEIMNRFFETEPSLEEYVQGLPQKELISFLSTLKITFKYTQNKTCDEKAYGDLLCSRLLAIVYLLSQEQRETLQKEYLELYIHYQAQMSELPKALSVEINGLTRDMVVSFEDDNPYLGLKDTALLKSHITVMKDLACSEKYLKGKPIEKTTERTLTCIVDAMLKDKKVFSEVFDHLMTTIVEISKSPVARKQGENVFAVFKYLFMEMAEMKITSAIVKSSVNMILGVVPNASKSRFVEKVADKALVQVLSTAPKLSPEDVKMILNLITVLLQSGRNRLVAKAKPVLENMKDTGVLDWKSHIEEAKKFLEVVGEIPRSKLQDDKFSEVDVTVNVYYGFTKVLLTQLKRGKVMPKLQTPILSFFINCLSVSTPLKSEIAEIVSSGGYLNISPKDKDSKILVLQKLESLLKNKKLPWSNPDLIAAVFSILQTIIESYDGNGKDVSPEENELFISIFKISGEGDSVSDQFYEEDDETLSIHGNIYQYILMNYVNLHQQTSTLECLTQIIPDILKWAKISLKEKKQNVSNMLFTILNWIGTAAPTSIKDRLPQVLDLMLTSDKAAEIFSLVQALYPHNTKALHTKLQTMFDRLDNQKDQQRAIYINVFHTVAQSHPEVFTKGMVSKLFAIYKRTSQAEKSLILLIIKFISEKNPSILVEFLPQLCDEKLFKPDSMNLRSGIIACVGGINATLGQQAVDYLMKFADHSDPTVSQIVMGTVSTVVRDHIQYMQKYKAKLEKLEKTSTIPQVRDIAHEMILKLEGKSVENIADDLQQQQEDIADLDVKVDTTIGTVIAIGGKVVEHDKEIGELGEGLERVEERVEDVEEDLGDTKIKVEEIDNKTMSNAPKWSRDLTKLMNPTTKNDWRLLASRLGYSNEDIRGWATQHDPCMALLSEWYATHKTSEASYGVLTALTEMNRMDAVVIVENAMKAAEDVVEDEDFEYPSPPPVFLSYQWGFQNEVKLLKQHLNMAGYECWMDVGQMGGGDKLFAKIDNGIRGAKIVICCVTEKYAQSPNCNREVNLSVNLNKPIIPLLMEKMDWPPKGSMGPIFSEYLFIRFFQRVGEETHKKDQRYWPIPKFQELLMQLNFFVVPDQKMVKKEYAKWWSPMIEDIVIDKNKGKKQTQSQNANQNDSQVPKKGEPPMVFLSYQWGKQPQIKALYKRLTSLGYTVWMDIYQMGGGDSLYDKIDRGMRGCKAVVSCVTQKYSLSANCRREISLADALKKPIIPLLMEQMKWPPDGPMSMVFTELLFINFHRDEAVQMTWKGEKFDELMNKLRQCVPELENLDDNQLKGKSHTNSSASSSGKGASNNTVSAKSPAQDKIVNKKTSGNSYGNQTDESKDKADSNQNTIATKQTIKVSKGNSVDINLKKTEVKLQPSIEKTNSTSGSKSSTSNRPSANNESQSSKSNRPSANSESHSSTSIRPSANNESQSSSFNRPSANNQSQSSTSSRLSANNKSEPSTSNRPSANNQSQSVTSNRPSADNRSQTSTSTSNRPSTNNQSQSPMANRPSANNQQKPDEQFVKSEVTPNSNKQTQGSSQRLNDAGTSQSKGSNSKACAIL